MASTDEEIEGETFLDSANEVLLLGSADLEKRSGSMRPVTLANQLPADPINIPDETIMRNAQSLSWDSILHGNTGNPWQHLKDGLFAFIQSVRQSASLWAVHPLWLLRTQALIFLLMIGAATATTVLTANGTFNMAMHFTFDKLIGGAYPAAPSVVGTVDLGWFAIGGMWWWCLIVLFQMLMPNFYLRVYIAKMINMRKDHVFAIIMAGVLAMYIIIGLGVIGVTNVLLIVLMTSAFVGTWLRYHLTTPSHYGNSFSVLDAITPVGAYDISAGTVDATFATNVTFQDYAGKNGRNTLINTQDGPARQSSLAYSKQIIDYVALARAGGIQEPNIPPHPIMSDLPPKKHKSTLRHYASVLSHTLNPYHWSLFDEIIPIMSYIVLFIVYYATALQNDHSAFKWNVHFFFWWLFLSLLVDYIVTRYHWSNSNQHSVKHLTFKGTKAIELLIDWHWFSWAQWTYWGVSIILCTFILLAPTRNLATTLPPY